MNYLAILITLLSGLSFFIGYFITKFVKDEKKLIIFSVGFSFSVILGLIFLDLLPEVLETLNNKLIIILCVFSGIILLKLLDLVLPNHSHNSKIKNHMEHIGVISAIALFLHNIIEGTAIYTNALSDIKLGIFMMLAVSFHNIPIGIQISSLIQNRKEKISLLSLLSISSIIGIVILIIFNVEFSDLLVGVLMSISLGMLIYISIFELLHEIIENINKKELKLGLISGIILILIGFLLH